MSRTPLNGNLPTNTNYSWEWSIESLSLFYQCIDRQRHYQRNQKSVLHDQLWIFHPSSQGKKIRLCVNLLSTCTVNYSRLSVRENWDLKLSSESRGVGRLFPLFPSQITVVLEHYCGTARQPQFQLYAREEKNHLWHQSTVYRFPQARLGPTQSLETLVTEPRRTQT